MSHLVLPLGEFIEPDRSMTRSIASGTGSAPSVSVRHGTFASPGSVGVDASLPVKPTWAGSSMSKPLRLELQAARIAVTAKQARERGRIMASPSR
jgi:hypothetical protein